jgi:GNAT superfamily N-acetyltransferase
MATCLSMANDDHIKCDDLAVETVTNAVQLSEWLGFYGVFEFKMFERLIELPEVMLYIGRIGEKAVGSSMLFLGAGVAGFYQVQVLPEYRRRGIGTALTVVPMRDARQAGYSYAVLQASTMGEPVYLRIGFESYFHYAFYHPVGYTYSDFIAVPGPRRN